MSELESLFSAAVPSSGAKKSNTQSSAKPKSDKVQLVTWLQFIVAKKVLMDTYITYLFVSECDGKCWTSNYEELYLLTGIAPSNYK